MINDVHADVNECFRNDDSIIDYDSTGFVYKIDYFYFYAFFLFKTSDKALIE